MMTSPVNNQPFDYRTTPADPDNGVLAEVFRMTPGTVSSDHPEGRFSARGWGAQELVDDVPWDDYYGPGSPLERLAHAGGKILRLGADIETVTLLHYAEYLADIPGKRRVTRAAAGTRPVSALDDECGIVDWRGPDYFGLILLEYLGTGRARQGQVGGAQAELIEARELIEFAARWMNQHLRAG